MKKNYIYIAFLFFLVATSCKKDFLSAPTNNVSLTPETVFSDSLRAAGFLANIYAGMFNESISINNGAWGFCSMVDEVTDPITFNPDGAWINGSLNSQTSALEGGLGGLYTTQYALIRKCNLMLKYKDLMKFSPALKQQYLGETYFLRAFFYFQMLERYGGVPIVTEAQDASILTNDVKFSEYKASAKRSSFDGLVKFILSDIQSAQAMLPWYPPTNNDYNKATAAAAVGLKSRLLLYAASPLFNHPTTPATESTLGYTSYDVNRWKLAADAAQEFFTLNMQNGSWYSLYPDYTNLFLKGQDPGNREMIWYRNTFPFNAAAFYPGRTGTIGYFSFAVTANLVDLYETRNGKAIDEAGSNYNAANPFANRDARLGFTLGKSGDVWQGLTMQLYPNGLDQNGKEITGVFIKKYMPINSKSAAGEKWSFIRLGEIYLNLAEALNEYQGPTTEAYTALNMTRQRPTVSQIAVTAGTLAKSEFRKVVQRERSVELALENHRFFDLRRWMSPDISKNIEGWVPTLSGSTTTWSKVLIANNYIKLPAMYLYPFPNNEVLKTNGALKQNPGY